MRTRVATLVGALALVTSGALVSSVEYSAPADPGGQNWRPVASVDVCRCAPAGIEYGRALVFGCRAWRQWPSTAYAQCDGGVGGVRVVADCWYSQGDYTVRAYGPYVGAGSVSSGVQCAGGSYAVNAFYQTF